MRSGSSPAEAVARSGRLLGSRDPVEAFGFIEREKADHPVATLARLLKVSRSGYYAWRARPASKREVANAALGEVIKAIFDDSRGKYGARRVHAELREEFEVRASRHRVARLMRLPGLQGVHRRKGRGRKGR